MSIGNLKTQGNKGNNFPYQLAVLELLGTISSGIAALPGVDYETRTTMFQANAPGAGYSIGDIIIRYDIIDVATSTISATLWFNQTTQATIAAPIPAHLTPIAAPSTVTVINGVAGAAVNIQDGGNSITVDSLALDVLLSSRASEATALLALTQLQAINADLDVALSTRASEATLLVLSNKIVQQILDYGVSTAALRTAAQIGNATGAADFNTGVVSAQTIRTTLATNVALPAGENHLGAVGGDTGYVEVTMTLDTNVYASGDVLTDTVSLTNILRKIDGTGLIYSIHLLDEDAQSQSIDVVFFRTNVSLGIKNAAITISDSDAREILGVVNITTSDYVNLVNSSSVTMGNIGIGVKGDGTDDLFMSMICRSGTPTYTAAGITVKVVVLQD